LVGAPKQDYPKKIDRSHSTVELMCCVCSFRFGLGEKENEIELLAGVFADHID